jgi:hypothetical protein
MNRSFEERFHIGGCFSSICMVAGSSAVGIPECFAAIDTPESKFPRGVGIESRVLN